MIRGLLVPVLSAAALLPAAAWAEPAFDAFKELCVAPATSATALAAADVRGWKPIPKEMLAKFPSLGSTGATPSNIEGRLELVDGAPKAGLIVGHIAKVSDDLNMGADICLVISPSADAAALEADAAGFAGVPVNKELFDDGTTRAFAWREGPAGRKPATKAELERVETALGAKILVVEGRPNLAMVGLLTPTK